MPAHPNPSSSCECERMFSELGDLLAPRRRNIGSQLLAALQCVRAWISAGMSVPTSVTETLNDDDLERLYDITTWEQLT
ncbi:Dimer-Tnp-hAT domain containing protein [Pyrenophora tritici-repentis]|nr:Dimer-Tnp-hAT domain containing protein [Pyrenophora tritici-repentis]